MQSVRFMPEHQSAIVNLLDDVPFKHDIWHWQFEGLAGEAGFDPVVIENNGKIIGFNGVIPADVMYQGQQIEALWSCDFYVDVACRGQGVGHFIKQNLVKKSPLIMAFGVSKGAAQVLQKIGWSKASNVRHYRYIRQCNKPRFLAMQCLQWLNLIRGRLRRVESSGFDLEWFSRLPDPERVNALWQRVEPGYQKVVRRDYRYLNWRYQLHPQASYRFLCANHRVSGQLLAILVIREHRGVVRLVDWVGGFSDYCLARTMIHDCRHQYAKALQFTATTTGGNGFSRALSDLGFFPGRTRPSFFVSSRLPQDSDPACGWFLTAGDSDGEFLLAAKDHHQANHPENPALGNPDSLSLVNLSEQDFASLSGEWEHLLQRSAADSLFMSWSWLFTWWQCWGNSLGLELLLLAVYDGTGTLQGLGPFFRHRHRIPVGISVSRVHLIGNAWRIQPTVRTEYCGLIVDQQSCAAVRNVLYEGLLQEAWDELILSDLSWAESEHWRELVSANGGLSQIPRKRDAGVRIDARPPFAQWLQGLGKNTRLKLYNRRDYLKKNGQLCHERVSVTAMQTFLQQLNDFHQQRWGKPCFDSLAIAFHRGLVSRLGSHEHEVVLSEIRFDGDCIAVQYDIRARGIMYNIQAGFKEAFDQKVALGTLHLGYLIEASFADPRVEHYDLLAGYGKNTFYKSHLNGQEVGFYTLQIARHPLLRLVYQCQALLPQPWRKGLNRIFRL